MERQLSHQNQRFCSKCAKWINMNHFLVHEIRCKGNAQHSNIRPQSSSMRRSRINSRNNLNNFNNYNQIQQRIPCSFCGYGMTLKQLDTHPAQCQNQDIQCRQCHKNFPKSLMQDHLYVCQARRHPEQFMQDEQQEIQSRQQPRRRRQPLQFFNFNPFRRVGMPSQRQQQRQSQPRHLILQFGNGFPIILQSSSQRRQGGLENDPFFQLIQLLAARHNEQKHPSLNKQEINKLQKIQYHQKKGSDKDLCTICYCQFEQNETINKLSCNHLYHHECIGKWLQTNASCPVCKKSMIPQNKKRQQRHREEQ